MALFLVWTPRIDRDPSRGSTPVAELDALALDPAPSDLQAELDELELDWFEFEPTTGDGAFRPLYLPFEYECRSGRKDENQAYVFPHLLSYKFDFVPDNNSYYHPFFVFKRDRATIRALRASPSADRIQEYAYDWGGSHVIGGTLIQDGDVFGGNIRAHDEDGVLLFEREYPVELRYFELMGRMARDWIAFRGQTVTAELSEELGRPMCSDPEALRLLGKAALASGRSSQWKIFESILELAPEFAELRHWYANQRQWSDGNVQRGQVERGKALADHLVLRALTEFRVPDCPDPALVEVYRESLRRAREISPEDPRLLAEEIYDRGRRGTLTMAEYDAYLWVPKRWPGFITVQRKLYYRYRTRNALEKSMPLALSALRSGAFPAQGGFAGEWSELALGSTLLGDFQRARNLAQEGLQEEGGTYETALLLCCSGTALRELGWPKEASAAFARAHEQDDQEHLFALGCLTSLEGGNAAAPELIATLVGDAWRPIVEARGLVAQGRHREALQRVELAALGDHRRPPGFHDDSRLVDPRFEVAMVRAEASLASGDGALAREATHHALLLAPHSRRARRLWERAHFLEPQSLQALRAVEQFLRPTRKAARQEQQPAADELELAAASSAALLAQAGSLSGDERRAFWWSQPAWSVERLALVLASAGALDEAMELYLAYADASQEISDAQEIHGRVFVRKLLARAEDDVRAAWLERLSGLPSGPYWHYGEQGLRLYFAERYEEALPFFQKALRTTTGDRWFSYHAGYCLRSMGDLEGAIDAFRYYLETRPEDGAALFELGKSLQRTGREAEACEKLAKSVRTGKGPQEEARQALREVGLRRAGSLEDEGMTEAALKLLLTIDELGAADAAVLEAIAEKLEALNRSQEASDYRQRAGRARDAADPGE